jgi:dihydrofolate reductase
LKVSAIAAMSINRVIGLNNKLPWHIPEDLKFFKQITFGHSIIMGRKTFESFGKALPGRENIILTRQQNYQPEGCFVFHELKEALSFCREKFPREEIFIGGGAEIYRQALPLVERIYLTVIDLRIDGDTFFPELPSDFQMLSSRQSSQEKPQSLKFEFQTWERKISAP